MPPLLSPAPSLVRAVGSLPIHPRQQRPTKRRRWLHSSQPSCLGLTAPLRPASPCQPRTKHTLNVCLSRLSWTEHTLKVCFPRHSSCIGISAPPPTPLPPRQSSCLGSTAPPPPLSLRPHCATKVRSATVLQCTSLSTSPSLSVMHRLAGLRQQRNGETALDPLAHHLAPDAPHPELADVDSLTLDADSYLATTAFLDGLIASQLQDPLKDIHQVVLVSAGAAMDASRPFRLPLPRNTVVFDVSPAHCYEWASAALKGAGVSMPPGTVLRHVSFDVSQGDDWRDEGWGEKLCRMGYRGDRPSIWVLQDCSMMSAPGFLGVLGHARGLAKCGSAFVGEIAAATALAAASLAADSTVEPNETPPLAEIQKRLASLFASYGFYASLTALDGAGSAMEQHPSFPSGAHQSILFHGLQQRLSDIEIEAAQREIGRAEQDGDEEGFEDAP